MEGKPLRILWVNNTQEENPSFVVRNKIVADALSGLGHKTDCRVKGFSLDVDDYDIFVFNRFYEGTLLKEISFLKSIGKKIVYETDDNYEAINESHPFHKIKSYGVLSSRELAELADAITCSTPELKKHLSKYAPNTPIHVIPNALDYTQYPVRKAGNKTLRIGFQGSNIHTTDLLMIIDAISDLQREYGFEFHIFGIDDRPFKELYKFCQGYKEKWQWVRDFTALYERLEGMRYVHHKTVPYEAYRRKLADLNFDIGICPLADNAFNRSKSCLKYYEYAAVGTVALASRVEPYSDEMDDADLAKNRYKTWYTKLKKLIVDVEHRRDRMAYQFMWAKENRDIEKMKYEWEKTFQIINNQ